MEANQTSDKIAPLTEADVARAADGNQVDRDAVREALRLVAKELRIVDAEWAECVDTDEEYSEPTIVHQTDDYVCALVAPETWDATIEGLVNDHDVDPMVARSTTYAHNNYARRHGASPTALGAMHAVVLPRTDVVNDILFADD
jgi:hypothetical protein